MIKILKKKLKNPIVADYGYHATNSNNLPSIMKLGLIPGFNKKPYTFNDLEKISDYFYNHKQPIYFADLPDISKLPESLVYHFKKQKYDIWLKTDTSNLNQLPDLLMLILDFQFLTFNNHLIVPEPNDSRGYLIKDNKSLNKIIKKYNYEIPFDDLIFNDELIEELIFLTGTFVINEKISPQYIKEITKIKY